MEKLRVALCHQTVMGGDAIGNDILGMYDLLERLNFEPVVVCEYYQNQRELRLEKLDQAAPTTFGLVVYHHSQYWTGGEKFLDQLLCPVILRYHNITPAEFFAPFSSRYAAGCAAGREMTRRLVDFSAPHLWLADSGFNLDDLVAAGIQREKITVSPPFNRTEHLLAMNSRGSSDRGTFPPFRGPARAE